MSVAVCRNLYLEKTRPSFSTAVKLGIANSVTVFAQATYVSPNGTVNVFLEGSLDAATWFLALPGAILSLVGPPVEDITTTTVPEQGSLRVRFVRLRFEYSVGQGPVTWTSVSATISTNLVSP